MLYVKIVIASEADECLAMHLGQTKSEHTSASSSMPEPGGLVGFHACLKLLRDVVQA